MTAGASACIYTGQSLSFVAVELFIVGRLQSGKSAVFPLDTCRASYHHKRPQAVSTLPVLSVVLLGYRVVFGSVFLSAQRPLVVVVILCHATLHNIRAIRPFSARVDESPHSGHMGARNLRQALRVETVVMLTLFLIGRRLPFLDLRSPRTGKEDTFKKPFDRRRRTLLISSTFSNFVKCCFTVRDEEGSVGGNRGQDDADLRADDEEVGLPHGVYRAGAFDACDARDCDQDDHGRQA